MGPHRARNPLPTLRLVAIVTFTSLGLFNEVFRHPAHPYTQGLIRSIPRIDTAATHKVRLETIAGTVPKLISPGEGCRFAARCKHATPACTAATPPLREISPGHKVACILDITA